MRRISSRTLMAGVLLGVIGISQLTRAQDDADTEEERPAQQARARAVLMTDEQFERALFGRIGGAEYTHKRFEAYFASRIHELDQMYGLLPEHKKKLEVVARHEVQRFFDSVRETKERLDLAGPDLLQRRTIGAELVSLRIQINSENPPIDHGLFTKLLRKILADERYSRHVHGFVRSRVDRAVSHIDRRLGLSHEQHRRLVNLIADETLPLKQYGEYDVYALLFQASKLPEGKFKLILDDAQMRQLRAEFLVVKGYKSRLIAKGYITSDG